MTIYALAPALTLDCNKMTASDLSAKGRPRRGIRFCAGGLVRMARRIAVRARRPASTASVPAE